MQFKLDRLPEEGSWDLYVVVRVDAEPGREGDLAVRVGFAPPMGRFTPVTVGEASRGYTAVRVPGGPFAFEINHLKSVYLQAPPATYVRHVYLDRMVAVRR